MKALPLIAGLPALPLASFHFFVHEDRSTIAHLDSLHTVLLLALVPDGISRELQRDPVGKDVRPAAAQRSPSLPREAGMTGRVEDVAHVGAEITHRKGPTYRGV